MAIKQRDQYSIPITVKLGEQSIDDTVDELLVKIGDVVKKKSTGELVYTGGKWYFPLTQEKTGRLQGYVKTQVQVRIDDNVFNSACGQINIGVSIITAKDE